MSTRKSDNTNSTSMSLVEIIDNMPMTPLVRIGSGFLMFLVIGIIVANSEKPDPVELAKIAKAKQIAKLDAKLAESELYKHLLREINDLKKLIVQ